MRYVRRVRRRSAKTCSRVFNEDPHVTEDTRERVRWAMQKTELRTKRKPQGIKRKKPPPGKQKPGIEKKRPKKKPPTNLLPGVACRRGPGGRPGPFPTATLLRRITSSSEIDLGRARHGRSGEHLGQGAELESPALEALLRPPDQRSDRGLRERGPAAYLARGKPTPMGFVDRPPKALSAVRDRDDLAVARQAVPRSRESRSPRGPSGSPPPITTVLRRLNGLPVGGGRAGTRLRPDLISMPAASAD